MAYNAGIFRQRRWWRYRRKDVFHLLSTIVASAAQTLPEVIQNATANVGNSISAVQTLPILTQSVVMNFGPNFSSAQTLPNVTQNANVVFGDPGSVVAAAAQTLTAPTTNVTMKVGNNFTSNQVLPVPINAAVAYVSPAFRVVQTLPAVTQSVVMTFTGAVAIEDTELLSDPVRIDPRLPSPNRDYERRWLGDNMLETQKRLRQTSFVIDVSTDAIATAASLLQQALKRWVLPAEFFTQDGQILKIVFRGTTSNNADQKTLRVKFGSTTLITVGPFSGSNKHWAIECVITCLGAASQKYGAEGRVNQELPFIAQGSCTEDGTAEISIEITGQSNTIAAAEVTLHFAELQHTLRN